MSFMTKLSSCRQAEPVILICFQANLHGSMNRSSNILKEPRIILTCKEKGLMPGAEKSLHSTSSSTTEESAILLISANQCSARMDYAKELTSQKIVTHMQTVMRHDTVSDLISGLGCTNVLR